MTKPFKRLLLTGAAGGLGKVLRERLKAFTEVLRLSDIADLGAAAEGEEIFQLNLADKAAVLKAVEGCDAILHFGGISTEYPFEDIMFANIQGTYNIYEAAHRLGVKRIVFASSNHAIGFYKQTEVIDADARMRPDSMYGLSKCYGELLGQYYFERAGIETVALRIGSSFPEPKNPRMMRTWFSYDDLVEALRCSLVTPRVGFTVLYGMSDNPAVFWDNRKAAHLGFRPKDSSAQFAHLFPDTGVYPAEDDANATYHGGGFIFDGPKYK
ncbi:NAD(P)-dependent oxidoreductase [Massilia sp. TS11]|uniref:NAD-dependent epimerase/dehydratase family protein n=1 Tax=Massilia sp. TS11 TaxID=2908003 RepID=UPI001EDB45EC|nr:NAD(P)-dependent oxidoreductase [Massilia sp. TS11]MCG2583770.1 NAD(P)-dependent oxidoreductase [Massilia sp. TS11]